jgi:hypothetical protein
MRLVRLTLLTSFVLAAAPATAADLTADQVVDRMVAANAAWLRADGITNLSYVIDQWYKGKQPAPDATIKVWYRAPKDLRIESEPGHKVMIWRDGHRYPSDPWACKDCDAAYVRDVAIAWVVFRGGMWELANRRNQCKLEKPRRERVEGRNAYGIRVTGYCPPAFPLNTMPSPSDCYDWRELWIDAETFRPLREAWNDGCTPGSPYFEVVRYADWQPFPSGGEAPMKLEFFGNWPEDRPLDAEPEHEPTVDEYQVVEGKYWLRRGDKLHDLSLAPVPETVFKDEKEIERLTRMAELRGEGEMYFKEKRWEDLYRVCDEFSTIAQGSHDFPAGAFELFFWHGDYEKAIQTMPPGLFRPEYAWAYDAIGRRDDALRVYRLLSGASSAPPEVREGLERPWIPIATRLEPADDEQLLKPSPQWHAETNAGGDKPQAAIDGNRRTRWTSATFQHPGMWFQVDLGAPIRVRRIAFDFVGDLTAEDEDYPQQYVLDVSTDGADWETIAQGDKPLDNLASASFEPRLVRYLRMTQEGQSGYLPWAINEVFVYGAK